jgi:NAD(P)-dependent dehydrogenase (short-subunit alcohol dehydrogenase family)
MTGRLNGKVAWISGGTTGMGRGTLELFVEEGAKVLLADIQDERGKELEAKYPDQVKFVHTDITDEDQIANSYTTLVEEFGGLDIVFNNAGAPGPAVAVEENTVEEWDRTQNLLLRSTMLSVKHAVPHLKARGGGSIINNASGTAIFQYGEGTAYGTAKGGVVQFTRLLTPELGPFSIRVNVIVPGWIVTRIAALYMGANDEVAERMMHYFAQDFGQLQPLPFAGLPRDIGEAVLFLGSDASRWITGVTLPVDGGLLVKNQFDPELPGILQSAYDRAVADLAT